MTKLSPASAGSSYRTAGEEGAELALQPLGGELIPKRVVVRGIECEYRDVGAVALVSGSRVRDLSQGDGSAHASNTSARGATASRSMDAEYVITEGVTAPR